MKKVLLVVVMVAGFCLVPLTGWASVYVSDNLEASLRNGPGTQYRIIAVVRSGDAVEILEERDGWSHVRSVDGTRQRQGWILSRYLMEREPWETQYADLEKAHGDLRTGLSPMEEEFRRVKEENIDLKRKLQENENELEALKGAYTSLETEATDFLELRERYEQLKSNIVEIENELAKTAEEKEYLESSHTYRWFLAGALVLLFGLLIGMLMGKRDRGRSSKLY